MTQPTYITLNPAITNLITAPGYYVVENSVQQPIMGGGGGGESSPTNPNILLSIQSSNVKLNLGGQVLTGSGFLTAPYSANGLTNDTSVDCSIGIYVEGSYQNIEIYNGTLQYFSIMAVDVNYYNANGPNPNPLILTESISVHDLITQYCNNITLGLGLGSISIFSTVSAQAYDLQFLNNNFGDLELSGVSSVIVRDIISEGLRGGFLILNNPSAYLLALPEYQQYGADAVSVYCSIANVQATPTVGSNVLERIHINDVQAGAAIFGIYLTSNPEAEVPSNQQCIVRDCEITNMVQPVSDLSAWDFTGTSEFRGLAIEGFTSFARVQNIKVGNLKSNITTGPGFFGYDGGYGTGGFWNSMVAYNVEGNVGGIWFEDCEASNISSPGWIQTTPYANSGTTMGQTWPSAFPVAGFWLSGDDKNNVTFSRCTASVVDAGSTGQRPTVAAGYYIQGATTPGLPTSFIFEDCAAAFISGSSDSADFLVSGYSGFPTPVSSLVFDRCIAQNNASNQAAPVPYSAGFKIGNPAINVTLRECVSQGHGGQGYALYAYNQAEQTPEVYQSVIFEDCTSQGEQGPGFELQHPFNRLTLRNCLSQSNEVGYKLTGRNVNMSKCSAEFNKSDGILVERFFDYTVQAVSSQPLSSINIYGGQFQVQPLFGASPADGFLLFPTGSDVTYPPTITIGGVSLTVPVTTWYAVPSASPPGNVVTGSNPTVLLLGEGKTGGSGSINNGVYVVQLQTPPVIGSNPPFTINGVVTQVYAFYRVNPWVVGKTVSEGQQIHLAHTEDVYRLDNTIQVGTTVPIIEECRKPCSGKKNKDKCSAKRSDIVIRDCSVLQNCGCGLRKNGARGVKVSKLFSQLNRSEK